MDYFKDSQQKFMWILVINPFPKSTFEELGIKKWLIWTGELSSFDRTFEDKATFLLLEGEVKVTPEWGQPIKFGKGDLFIFPSGINCRWDVHRAFLKHYRFGD